MTDSVNRSVGQSDRMHPNWKSTIMSSPPSSRSISDPTRPVPSVLARGKLFSVQTRSDSRATQVDGRWYGLPDGGSSSDFRINTTLFKDFQYNPPELQMALSLAPVNPDGTENPGGNFDSTVSLGAASTAVELLFDRTQEQHAGQRVGSQYREFARLGVAKDILDVYAVIRGDEELLRTDDTRSLTNLTAQMTDLVARGSGVLQAFRVALAYSPDFIIFGFVTSMNFRFVKFNHQLIPTMGFVTLNIDIFNLGNQRLVYNEFGVDPATTPRGVTSTPVAATRRTYPTTSSNPWGGRVRPI